MIKIDLHPLQYSPPPPEGGAKILFDPKPWPLARS